MEQSVHPPVDGSMTLALVTQSLSRRHIFPPGYLAPFPPSG